MPVFGVAALASTFRSRRRILRDGLLATGSHPSLATGLHRTCWQIEAMWEWNSNQFRTRSVDEEPVLAAFASGLVVERPGSVDIDVNRSILSRYRLRALPLVEWDMSPDAPLLFEALRTAGAKKGYFLDYPFHAELGHAFRECDLTPAAAAVVRDEHLFGWATVFVDDSFLAVIAAWFSDLTYWCMSPALFDQYLAAKPMLRH